MRVLIGCEFSGTVRDAFISYGHDAWSCDLESSEGVHVNKHIKGDLLSILNDDWDLMIAHPPCTHLAISGAKHFWYKESLQNGALDFVKRLMECPIKRICIENPISIISTKIRKPDQIIQPWMFGHGETKATCLWLKNLPYLKPTQIVEGREARIHNLSSTKSKERSRTYDGAARAMAYQWGSIDDKQLLTDSLLQIV